jgi:hypothetical protein
MEGFHVAPVSPWRILVVGLPHGQYRVQTTMICDTTSVDSFSTAISAANTDLPSPRLMADYDWHIYKMSMNDPAEARTSLVMAIGTRMRIHGLENNEQVVSVLERISKWFGLTDEDMKTAIPQCVVM